MNSASHTTRRMLVALALLGASLAGLGCTSGADHTAPMATKDFEFISGGKTLSGIIDRPASGEAQALIVFVHGSGPTNIREENRYFDLRSRFADLGITSVMWDKPGQGRSEGEFDDNQPLEESAQEVLDAIAYVRDADVAGSHKIGIWGASRGGWVAPIAMSQDPNIEFWISLSGVPAEDNKYYLMKSNLPLDGSTPEETERLMDEWTSGRRIALQGGDYDTYLAATENLREDPLVRYYAGNLTGSREEYEAEQEAYLKVKDDIEFEEETLSVIRVRNFSEMLSGLDVDVLALFGEKDTNVDWRKARTLYQSTVGRNPAATLAVRTFPDANHVINVSETGTVREVEGTPIGAGVKSAGYYKTQMDWLREYVVRD